MTDCRPAAGAIPPPPQPPGIRPDNCLCPGYRATLDSLYRSEAKALRAWLARRVDQGAVDDLAQEVFLRAACCPQLVHLHNPRGFLRRIARNLIIDRARRQERSRSVERLLATIETATAPQQEEGLHERETLAAFESSLAHLPARTARIFAMSRVERKTYRQISEELKIAPSTVEYHMMRALRRVRSGVAEACADRIRA